MTAEAKSPVAPRIACVLVTFNHVSSIRRALESLIYQLEPGDELYVVDNGSTDGTAEQVVDAAPGATVLRLGANLGFAAACNRGAEGADAELLVFMNPDVVVEPGCIEALKSTAKDEPDWAGWMGLVTLRDGQHINTSGGVIHYLGFSWAGNVGRQVSEVEGEPYQAAFLSGACLCIRREVWERLGGFPPAFFMYFEDVDLSLRLRLQGLGFGVQPRARVNHGYEFLKGARKWYFLERNRWFTLIRTYPAPLFVAVLPVLLCVELALLAYAARNGWVTAKLRSQGAVIRALPRLMRERREIQGQRRVPVIEFASWLTPDLSSPYLSGVDRFPFRTIFRAWWALVGVLLGLRDGPRDYAR